MATDLNKFNQELLEKAVEALLKWFKYQSMENTTTLYTSVSRLINSDFNPAEYDDVE